MNAQRGRPTQEQGPPPARAETRASRETQQDVSPEQNMLLQMYGEAMLRIGRLEEQMSRIRFQDLESTEGPATGLSPTSGDEAPRRIEPAEKLQDVQKGVVGSSGETEPAAAVGGTPRHLLAESEDEFRQLRLQLTALAGQLADAREQIHHARGSRRGHRLLSNGRRSRWKKLLRNLGLG